MATDVQRILSPEFYIDGQPDLCEVGPTEITTYMSLEILDSEPFVYDILYSGGKQWLAIARMGTIYTFDLSVKPGDPNTFTFNSRYMEVVSNAMRPNNNSNSHGNRSVGVINILPPDEDEDAKAFEIFDSLIDPSYPVHAHHPQCYIYFIKIIERPGKTPLMLSSAGDHHIVVFDFVTHQLLLDTDWIEPLCFCGTVIGNKAYLGGRNGDIVVLDLDTMKWEEKKLDVDLTLDEVKTDGLRLVFKTTDNSILVVDPDTLRILDAIPVEGELADYEVTKRGIFIRNTDNQFVAYI